jgi:hypothetical protein
VRPGGHAWPSVIFRKGNMKNIIIIAVAVFCFGCARLNVQTETWKMTATSFCKDIQVPKVTVTTPTSSITVEGYQSACNLVELQKVTDSVVSMIIKAGMNAVMK